MLFSIKTLYAITIYLAASSAAVIPGIQKRQEGIYKLDFAIQKPNKDKTIINGTTTSTDTTILKRADTYEYPLANKDVYYVADILVGSNKQKLSVDIDTGSSDLWVIDSAAGIQADYGTFDKSQSSTYKYVADGFEIHYGDGSYATGEWGADTVQLSPDGPTVTGQTLGDASDVSQITFSIFGIGYKSNEASAAYGGNFHYDNFPVNLKKQGYVEKNAYSLFLTDKDAVHGSVLFGGIDNAKYTGSLKELPIQSSKEFRISADSVSVGGQTISISSPVLLDSGTSYAYLDPSVASSIADELGAVSDGNNHYKIQDESKLKDITFNFGDLQITVPKEELSFDGYNIFNQYLGKYLTIIDGDNILGDTFLRHAYVVYNLDDNVISLAPIKYTDAEDISVIS